MGDSGAAQPPRHFGYLQRSLRGRFLDVLSISIYLSMLFQGIMDQDDPFS